MEVAVKRLEAALQGLEHAVEERLSLAVGADGLAEEVQMLTSDRARLAETLDQERGARGEARDRSTATCRAASTRRSRRSAACLRLTRRAR